MKILYIDVVESVSKIRVAEKAIFYDEMIKNGHVVDLLLRKPLPNKIEKEDVFYYSNKFYSKFYLNIPLIISLLRIGNLSKYDFIVCRNIISISLVPLIYSKFTKAKFIYIKAFPTDLFYLNSFQHSTNYRKKIVSGIRLLFHYIFDFIILRLSDKVITRTIGFSNYLKKAYFLKEREFFALPMGFDIYHFINDDHINAEMPKDLFSDIRYIGYFGSLAAERNLTFVLEVMFSLVKVHSDVRLLLLGALSSELNTINDAANSLGIANYILVKKELNRKDLYNYLKHVEFTISAIPPTAMYRISSPTKVVESLGLGIPVIANVEIFDQAELIDKTNCGIVVPYSVESFVQAALYFLSLKKNHLEEINKHAKNYININRSYSSLYKNIISYLTRI